jgi:TP901 family phage tail tape measure protein
VEGALTGLSDSAVRAADAAQVAGAAIDESLLQTASGTDAAELAATQLSAARAKLTMATDTAANAERKLMEAQAASADAGGSDAAAQHALVASLEELNAAQRELAKATTGASAAEARQGEVARAAAAANGEATAAADATAAANARVGGSAAASAGMLGKMSKAATVAAVAAAAIAVISVKAAGDFQSSTQHLVTDAGEAQKNLAMVQKGILQISIATGTTAMDLSNSMYHIESSGYHGAAGLNILKVAAEGAKVGGADFDTVGKTLTGTMNSYGMAGDQAVNMMNQLIATTAAGDMRMQDLASSLGNVAPLAAAAGLKFAQVGGAMATMTAQNMSAQQASQDLANTIRALSNPNNVAIKEMQNLGLNSNDLSKNLGKRGLTGTLEILTNAVATHTKGGEVLISTFNASKQAAANADTMIKAMPPSLQKLATGYLNGTTSLGNWRKELKTLPPIQASMMSQFGTLANKTHSFNDMLKGGSPAAQTYNAAMSKLLGGATGLNTSLMITGGRMEEFKNATDKISEAATKGGKHVEDWDKIQGTFNQKMDVLKASVSTAGIEIGTILLPAAQAVVVAITDVLGPMATWIGQHQKMAGLILAVAGGAAAAVIAIKAWALAMGALDIVMGIFAGEMEASGLAEIIILVAMIVAGLIYAYMHFDKFRAIVKAVFSAVKTAVVDMWHALEVAWAAIVTAADATGRALATAWNAVVMAAMAVWHALVSAWDAVSSATSTAWNAIKDFFAKWWPLLLVIFALPIAILLATWNHFHEQITGTAKAAWNGIKSFFSTIWKGIESTARALWLGIKLVIIQPIESAWGVLKSIWNAVRPYLSGIWNSIKGAASSAWSGIKTAIINPLTSAWHTVTTIGGNIAKSIKGKLSDALSAAKTTAGQFLSVGKAIIDGIVKGIENGVGSVASAAKSAAKSALSAAKSFLGIGSPSKKFAQEVGLPVTQGMAGGIDSNAHLVSAAAVKVAKSTVAATSSALGIASPSKVFRQLGIYLNEGLVDGITGSTASVKTATRKIETLLTETKNKLQDMLSTSAAQGKKGAGLRDWIKDNEAELTRLQSYAKREDTELRKLAAQRDSVATKLKAAKSKLATLQADWTKEKNSVASSIMQNASVIMQPVDQFNPLSSGDILANYKKQAADAQKFAQQLATLRKKGLSTAIIQQIAAAGVDQGEATAAALVNADSSTIKQMNKTQTNMQSAANATGAAVANSMYSAGIASAKGLVKGLQSQEKTIEAQMLKIAKSMEKAIKKALGIKSPSEVFANQVGKHIPGGIAMGVQKAAGVANKAVADLAGSMVTAADRSKQVVPTLLGNAVKTTAGLPYMSTSQQAGGGNVYFDLRGSQVMSDRDMDALVDKLGKRVATRILPAAGTHIRM